jgi:hypothetical protein
LRYKARSNFESLATPTATRKTLGQIGRAIVFQTTNDDDDDDLLKFNKLEIDRYLLL